MRRLLARSCIVMTSLLAGAGCSSAPEGAPAPAPEPTPTVVTPSGPCTGPTDCPSGVCENGACAAAPGKTCGTAASALCAAGEACPTDADCASDFCSAGTCAAPGANVHSDGRRNGGETDVDCGGTSAIVCAVGLGCKSAADCDSACTAGKCAVPSDGDGKKNNGETDVDCGGPNAKKCADGKACATGPDCGLGYCPLATCVKPTSGDSVQNGTESDVDCGGAAQTFAGVTVPAGPKCVLKKTCAIDADCESAVCSDSKHCIEAESCRPLHGGETCGTGEYGVAGAVHESCCRSLAVPGATPVMQNGVAKAVYLDKYEITAGRIRQWIKAVGPNIRGWVKARITVGNALYDPILAAQFPGDKADYLPSLLKSEDKVITDPDATAETDISLLSQLGPTSYVRGVLANGGSSGCAMNNAVPGQPVGNFKYGHRTYWFDAAESAYFYEVARPASNTKDVLDEKSMNCMTPIMFTAFCAWDGGYMQSQDAISKAYGPSAWPWGATPTPTDAVAKIANYNAGTGGFGNTKDPRYLWPVVNYSTFEADFTPIIAAPGRFSGDASQVLPAADTWMDLGGNMIEWSQVGGTWRGWTGSSFEGHLYPRAWTGTIQYLDKYGKGGSRCMRLK